jgi:DNA-binding winged helix-turn-helix (wHTH) protein
MKEFPPFRLDTVNQCLWRHRDAEDDERIRLTPKAFAVLRYLVEHAGRLVMKDEILEVLWPETYVQPEVLKSHIFDLRRALGDRATQPRFIETLPRRGYHFIAAVREPPSADPAAPAEPAPGRLVGRDGALGALRDCLGRTLRDQRQIVFITGEPGIGKTALVDEFQRQAAADVLGPRIARGQCIEGYGGKEAYYPMLEALGQVCRGPGGDAVFEGRLSEVAPELAHHFEAGAEWTRAVRYLRLAADTAGWRYAHQEATALLQHALAIVRHAVNKIEMLEQLATIYMGSFDMRALDTYDALAARAAHAGLIDVQVRTLVAMA